MGKEPTDSTQENSFQLPDRQWEYLLDRLEREEAVLFIGPGILPHDQHGTVEDALDEYLQEKSKAEANPFIEKFYRDDKFFMLNERDKDESLWNFMSYYRDFFTEKTNELTAARAVLDKITQIPFSTIISLSPNQLLEEAYGDKFAFHTDFYNKKKKPQPFVPGRKEDPLIYYMRGKMTADESMIISHNDLFDYLESIYEAKSMDADLKANLKAAKYFVFLGLPFESWYMQLLIRLFEFQAISPRILALKKFQDKDNSQKIVYEDLYKVQFYENDSTDFIQQLHDQCAARGLLKTASNQTAAANFDRDAEQFLSLIKAGQHEQSLASLEELSVKFLVPPANFNDYFNTLMIGASNFRSALRSYNISLITYDKYKTEEAKLVSFLNMQFQELKALVDAQ
ncbi:MAG: hypothetical protein DA408_04910 [Bacteroidetes bacterium]|nr:MAG: hypothetical protein C7N36_03875 [Bacteroidota bacterium]PTM13941.1 MAG: hypothetical protein DA408_04910 [Bacteroidota bacterium]